MSVLNTRFNGYLAPLIETNEKYIIQGQVYGKDDMKFEFMNFIPVDTLNTGHAPALIRRCSAVSNTLTDYDWCNTSSNGDMYIVDCNDPAITYALVDSAYETSSTNGGSGKAVKFKTENGVTEKIWDSKVIFTGLSSGGYPYYLRSWFYEVLGQNDSYIFVTVTRSNYDSNYRTNRQNVQMVLRINKSTGKFETVFDYNTYSIAYHFYGVSIKKIYDDENRFIYSVYAGANNTYAFNNVGAGQCAVYLYDKVNNSNVSLGTLDASSAAGNMIYTSQGFMLNNELHFYQYTNVKNPEIRLVKIDMINKTIESKNTTQTFNNKITTLPSTTITDAVQLSALTVNLFIKELDGKKYLNVMAYSTRGEINAPEFNKITTFLIDETNGDLIAQGYCDPFSSKSIRGFVEMIDENLILVTNRIATKVLRFDTIKGQFVEIQIIDISNNAIGCDSKNNIWIIDSSNATHKFSVELPVDVQLSFEKDSIDYTGVNEDNNLILEAYNYKNERIAVRLELTIKGPMTFEDGSKSMRISSSRTEKIKIPTVVKGSGIISVYPKVLL